MCGRYYIANEDAAEELKQIIDEVNRRNNGDMKVKMSGEIHPTDIVPVIVNNRKEESMAFAMKWGYTLSNGKPVFNARSETAAETAMFRDGVEKRRCLVPATNYFEWQEISKNNKIKYDIRAAEGHMIYMAGIYRWEGKMPVFSILTREPAESIVHIHNRMPVILPNDIAKDWLNTKYSATEIMSRAVTDVVATAVSPVQVGMLI